MLFTVQSTAMNGTERVLHLLDAIVTRVEDEVHELEVVQADDLEESRWYESSRQDRRKLLEGLAKSSLYRAPRSRGPHCRRIEVTDEASAVQARSIAYTPLLVLAENAVSDGALVEAALRVFGAPQTIELCFGAPSRLDPPAFQIESRGGHGELKKLLIERLREATERRRLPRLVVVTDSDGELQGEVKPHAVDIRQLCAAQGIPCPPLNKRTAENYIPDAVWHAWAAVPDHTNMRPAVEALLRLSREQRDYVDMADPAASLSSTQPGVAALFQSVSPADRSLLQQRNLKGKGTTMNILALRKHATALTRTDLQARDHQGDLQALVRHIEDEL